MGAWRTIGVSLCGNSLGVELRAVTPFPNYALPRLWSWVERVRGHICDDFAPKTIDAFVELRRAEMARGAMTWAVYSGDDLGGLIVAERISPIVARAEVLLHQRCWGATHDEPVPVIRSVCRAVFDSGLQKVQFTAFADNKNLIGVLKKAGGMVEGVLRGQTMRRGRPADVALVGIRKGE